MPSKRPVEPLDSFETDVPITPEDRAAQWRIRDGATMTSKEYLDWCSWITRDSVVPGRDFPKQPFELPNATTIEAMRELVTFRPMVEPEDLYEPEWVEWFRLTPEERWNESARLWAHYVAMGGSLDPEPDTQSPFYDAATSGRPPVDGRPGVRVVRRCGV